MSSVLESSYAWTGSFVEAFNQLACDVASYIYKTLTEPLNASDSTTSTSTSSSSGSGSSEVVDGNPVTNTPSTGKTLFSIPEALKDVAWLFEADDFQILLFKIFVAILIGNICLIYLAWHIYGERISERFMTPNLSPEELQKRVQDLKLPTEHSQRFA